jgi:hypothetical protein
VIIPLCVVVPLGILTQLLILPFKTDPRPYETIRQIALFGLNTIGKDQGSGESNDWTNGLVAEKVRLILSSCTGAPVESIHETDALELVE